MYVIYQQKYDNVVMSIDHEVALLDVAPVFQRDYLGGF